jgi:hypothetical protein
MVYVGLSKYQIAGSEKSNYILMASAAALNSQQSTNGDTYEEALSKFIPAVKASPAAILGAQISKQGLPAGMIRHISWQEKN